jgi:hypothetical protein
VSAASDLTRLAALANLEISVIQSQFRRNQFTRVAIHCEQDMQFGALTLPALREYSVDMVASNT